jgi:hypothetical protein
MIFLLLLLHILFSYTCSYHHSNIHNLQKYIYNNKIQPFALFSIVNNCCKCIMCHHKMLGEYHGNTTLANFYIYDDYKCVLLNNTSKESRKLTKPKQYNDYNIFFTSCSKELMHNNIYFIGILNRHKMSVFEALVLFQDKK